MSASPVADEDEQFHSGVEDEEELDDNIVLGARRSKASDDEGSDDEQETDKGADIQEARDADAGGARGKIDVNLPDDLEEGELSKEGADENARKPRPKLEPYMVPTSGAFYMHDDRFDDSVEMEKPRRTTKKLKDEDRWKHDKFDTLLNDEPDDEPPAHLGFRMRGRGRGRGRGRRGDFDSPRGRSDMAGPPPGFEDPSRPRRAGRQHPAEALKDLEGYDPNGSSFSPRALNPDAKPFRSNTDERPRGRGGRGSKAYERDRETFGDDAVNEGRSYPAGRGGSRGGDDSAEPEERPARGRGGGRRYSAMAGSLGAS